MANDDYDHRSYEHQFVSLRRDLAVTRAALAQCATALSAQCGEHVDNCCAGWCAQCREGRLLRTAVTANPDVEQAVRVEAARDAVIQAARPFTNMGSTGPAEVLRNSLAVLDALTSERRRDRGDS